MNTTERLLQMGNKWFRTSGATITQLVETIAAEFVLIPRAELPEVKACGFGTDIQAGDAHEAYQKQLYLRASQGDIPGEWSRKIAYANLAIAEAIDARNAEQEAAKAAELAADNAKLDAEALALYNANHDSYAAALGFSTLTQYRKLALAARKIYGVTK